jgi:hypothetical protein
MHTEFIIKCQNQFEKRKQFNDSPYFHKTTLDCSEAGLQILQQGFKMRNLLIRRYKLSILHYSCNFNLKKITPLNTKERRKRYFGNRFHMLRELNNLTKILIDCHVYYHLGSIDEYVLVDAIQYVFSHIEFVTDLYRCKY